MFSPHQLLERLDHCRPAGCTRAGWRSLQLGVLFLPTSALLSGLCLLASITVLRPKQAQQPLQRLVCRAFLLLSALMVLGISKALNPELAAIGLANWLPFFWFFLAVAPYLSTAASRNRVAFWVVIGTVPVIVVGLLQFWLGWSTPLIALGGLLEWSMRFPGRATGIFDTVNGTAGWLLISFPLLLQRLRQPQQSPLATMVILLLIALATTVMLLTSSRMAVVVLPVVVLLSTTRRQMPLVFIVIGLYVALVGVKLTGLIDHWPVLNLLVPDLLTAKLIRLIDADSTDALQVPEVRSSLYPVALQLVWKSPWLGIGENGFRTLLLRGEVPMSTTEGLNHTHSLPLEFALSHGLPALALLMATMGWVFISALQRWRQHTDLRGQDRAWLLAAGLVVWVHIWDIPAYDSRFNMLGWMIFAAILAIGSGLRKPQKT